MFELVLVHAVFALKGLAMLRPQVTIQPGSQEYKNYVKYIEKKYEDYKMIKAYLADPLVDRIAKAFAAKNYVPSRKQALQLLAVYKIRHSLFVKLSCIMIVLLGVGFLTLFVTYLNIEKESHDLFSVIVALYAYVVFSFLTLSFFMSRRFRAASFCVPLLTKHLLGYLNLNDITFHIDK